MGRRSGAAAAKTATTTTNEDKNDVDVDVEVVVVNTSPIGGMRPGTSGLRKKVGVWKTEHYVENFVQCLVDTAVASNGGRMIDT